jgi:hypothetical protein
MVFRYFVEVLIIGKFENKKVERTTTPKSHSFMSPIYTFMK